MEWLALVASVVGVVAGAIGIWRGVVGDRRAADAEERAKHAERRANDVYQMQVRAQAATVRAVVLYTRALAKWKARRGDDFAEMQDILRAVSGRRKEPKDVIRSLREKPIRLVAEETADEAAFPLIRHEPGVSLVELEKRAALIYFKVDQEEVARSLAHPNVVEDPVAEYRRFFAEGSDTNTGPD